MAVSRQKEVKTAVNSLAPAHLPFLFPEVFLRAKSGFDVLLGNPPWEKLHVEEDQWWGMHIPGLQGMPQKERVGVLAEFRKSRPDLEEDFVSTVANVDAMRKVISKGPYPGLGAAHIDLFQAFAWRNWQLLNSTGLSGIVMPRGALSGSSLQSWRSVILENGQFSNICFVTNTNGWVFEGVHQQYGIALIALGKAKNESLSFSGPFNSLSEFLKGRELVVETTSKELISWSPTFSFPQIPDPVSGEIFKTMRKQPRFDKVEENFHFQPLQGDLNATSDKDLFAFDTEEPKGRIPVMTGASYNLWNPDFGLPYAYADETALRNYLFNKLNASVNNKRSAYYGMSFDDKDRLPLDAHRIAFRDVTNSIDARTVIACLLPKGVAFSHQSPVLVRRAGTEKDEAYLLGLMSSIAFDWYMRRWVGLHLTFEILNPAPLPRLDLNDKKRARIIEIAGRLTARDSRYKSWAKSIGVDVGTVSNEEEQNELVAELDALSCLAYNLKAVNIDQIFKTYRRGWSFEDRIIRVHFWFKHWSRQK
jgi:hypothetical protein